MSDDFLTEINPDEFPIRQSYARCVLMMWKYRAWRNARAHYRVADRLRRHGVVIMVMHAVAAISVLGLANFDHFFSDEHWKIFVSTAGIAAVLIAIIQLLLRHESREQEHKFAAGEFSNLQRKLERYIGMPAYKMGLIHNINRELNFATKNYPSVPRSIWNKREKIDEEIDDVIRALEKEVDRLATQSEIRPPGYSTATASR